MRTLPAGRQRKESSLKRKQWDLSLIKSEDKYIEESESVQLIEAFLHQRNSALSMSQPGALQKPSQKSLDFTNLKKLGMF